jgi:hypothetical protein
MCHNIIGGDCSYFIEEKENIFLVPIAIGYRNTRSSLQEVEVIYHGLRGHLYF